MSIESTLFGYCNDTAVKHIISIWNCREYRNIVFPEWILGHAWPMRHTKEQRNHIAFWLNSSENNLNERVRSRTNRGREKEMAEYIGELYGVLCGLRRAKLSLSIFSAVLMSWRECRYSHMALLNMYNTHKWNIEISRTTADKSLQSIWPSAWQIFELK